MTKNTTYTFTLDSEGTALKLELEIPTKVYTLPGEDKNQTMLPPAFFKIYINNQLMHKTRGSQARRLLKGIQQMITESCFTQEDD